MELSYTRDDLNEFLMSVNFQEINANDGGMKVPDMFSLYFLLKKLRPSVVIESGVWNGQSTKLIRETLEDVTIISLDPRPIEGYIDENTTYYVGDKFKDFKDLDLSSFDMNSVLCFFDDHQNQAQRLIQCIDKNVKHVFFNDNYPVNCGSHFSIQHLLNNDRRLVFDIETQYPYSINTFPQIDLSNTNEITKRIEKYLIFPNIFSKKIEMVEGLFDCDAFLGNEDIEKYQPFYKSAQTYTWNTYILLN
jgi:hypothetical protein